MNQSFQETGFYPADILLPNVRDMRKWAVIACDQFTSQPAYWQKVEQEVGEAPTALRLVLPEVYLDRPDVEQRIQAVNACMETYLAENRFRSVPDSLVYVERTQSDGRIRHGIVGRIDLEQYDFTPGSKALIRATGGDGAERIPPRVRVREHAALELPHVMLLIDDPAHTVISPLESEKDDMERLYDTDLMLGGGRAAGYRLTEAQMERTAAALRGLITPEAMAKKYGRADAAPLLFAVGDGNHSLATARTCYEDLKKVTPPEQWASLPARYALVEVVNLHDPALQFCADSSGTVPCGRGNVVEGVLGILPGCPNRRCGRTFDRGLQLGPSGALVRSRAEGAAGGGDASELFGHLSEDSPGDHGGLYPWG